MTLWVTHLWQTLPGILRSHIAVRRSGVRSLHKPNSCKTTPVRAPVGRAEIRDGSSDSQESMEIDQSSSTRLKGAFGGERSFLTTALSMSQSVGRRGQLHLWVSD